MLSQLWTSSPLRRYSYVMRTNLVRVCAAMAGIVFFAAMQDMSPTVFGAKAPLLLAFSCMAGIPAAVVSGLFADSLGCLPFGCSAIFFLAVSVLVRIFRNASIPILIVSSGAFQVWLSLWVGGRVSVASVLFAMIVAVVFVPVMAAFLRYTRLHIGIADEGGAK